jgi:F0F1-type ATP synthase membrane subunit b/b'
MYRADAQRDQRHLQEQTEAPVNAREHQQEQELQQAMEDEADEIIDQAMKRPISKDEADCLRWHCGTLTRRH